MVDRMDEREGDNEWMDREMDGWREGMSLGKEDGSWTVAENEERAAGCWYQRRPSVSALSCINPPTSLARAYASTLDWTGLVYRNVRNPRT